MKKHICLSFIFIALASAQALYSQNAAAKLKSAEEHHKNYRFNEAAEIFRSFLESRPDSTLTTQTDSALNADVRIKLTASENGSNLLKFGSSPQLITKKVFPINDFYLNIPGFKENSWVLPPAEYAKGAAGKPYGIMNFTPDAKAMVFSAQDESGSWNIMYSVRLNDTIWSAPEIVNENVTTAGNEIFPHLSPCGKKLYFASNGHSGMGGYDLFVSQWNEETSDWDTAQNLGFPYSSTGNDYFYHNTPCGNFTIFSSDRETSENQVTTYVTLTEVMALKQEIPQKEAAARANFTFASAKSPRQAAAGKSNAPSMLPEQSAYLKAADELKFKREKLQKALDQLQNRRRDYTATTDSLKRIAMEKQMVDQEMDIMLLDASINSSVTTMQQMELEMLGKGLEIPAITGQAIQQQQQEQKEIPTFAFVSAQKGAAPNVIFEKIEPAVDLSFKIEKEAFIADLSEIPSGLIYHIQIMTAPKKASLKALKGFSPVFERKLPSGKYTYSVGIFHTYAEAQKNLATVKKKGFPTALITAYNNGKSVSTKQARTIEQQDNSIYRVTIGGYDALPQDAITVIRANTNRDIAKANINGIMKYVIGPFTNKTQAEALATALMAQNVTGVEIEKLENK